jgi:hypothetical protein
MARNSRRPETRKMTRRAAVPGPPEIPAPSIFIGVKSQEDYV